MRVRWIVTGVISAWNLSLKLLSSILGVWPLMSFICINSYDIYVPDTRHWLCQISRIFPMDCATDYARHDLMCAT